MKINCPFHSQTLIYRSTVTEIMKGVLLTLLHNINNTPFNTVPRYDILLEDIKNGTHKLKETLKVTLDWQTFYGDPVNRNAAAPARRYYTVPQAAPTYHQSPLRNPAKPKSKLQLHNWAPPTHA